MMNFRTNYSLMFAFMEMLLTKCEVYLYVGSFSSRLNVFSLLDNGSILLIDTISGPFINSPSWISLSKSKKFIYLVSEIDDYNGEYSGAVSAFSIDNGTKLSYLNTVSTSGANPTHLEIVDDSLIFVSNYCSGILTTVEILGNGTLGATKQVIDHNLKPAVGNCGGAHVHQVIIENESCFVMDLGLDTIFHYDFDLSTGLMADALTVPEVKMNPTSGPRHMVLHKELNFAFSVSELDSTLTTLHYDRLSGALTPLSTISSLRQNEAADGMGAGEIALSSNGKFVYISNRDISEPNQNRSSIGVFKIERSTGELSCIQHVWSFGIHPRHFVLHESARLLIVANKDSNNLVVFQLDDLDLGTIDESSATVYTTPTLELPTMVLLVDVGSVTAPEN